MLLGSSAYRKRPAFYPNPRVPGDLVQDDTPPIDVLGRAGLPSDVPGPVGGQYQAGLDAGQISAAPVPDVQKKQSIFDRIGSALSDPEVKGMLLRNGYSMLTGGNPMAGFAWGEQRRADAENQRRWQLGYGLQQRDADRSDFTADQQAQHYQRGDQTDQYNAVTGRTTGMGQVTNTANHNVIENVSNIRDNQARIRASQIGAGASMYGSDKDFQGRMGAAQIGADASRYGDDAQLYGTLNKPAAGIGTNAYKITTKLGPQDATYNNDGWFGTKVGGTQRTPPSTGGEVEQKYPVPPTNAIQAARKNPQLKGDFEQMFGPGSWGRFVGQ